MPENRDQLIEELGKRIQTFDESGDPTGVLDAAVPGLARDLAETLWSPTYIDVTPDVLMAMTVLVALHWMRYQLLPDGQDQDDLQACLRWAPTLRAMAPDQVPEPVQAYLDQRRHA
jgi:hypothetical protein